MPGTPFYAELAEELIKEDYSGQSKTLREKVLKKLEVQGVKSKTPKAPVSFKPILIEGLNAIGSSGTNLSEIMAKINENHGVLENQSKGIWSKIKKLMAQMANKEGEPVIYDLEYVDPNKGTPVREKLNFSNFCAEVEKKISILQAIAARGAAAKKLESMEENQLIELLQRNMKDVQNFHKTLNGLDDFFKNEVDKSDRARIKGVKPELSALKNAATKAGQKLHDYNAQKEEEEQFKKLGIAAEH
jgi:hypothetical protein